MKLYLSGKISGDPDYRDKFDRAARQLEGEGHAVINPAVLPDGLTQADYMRISLAMLDSAEALVRLPDWVGSEGAIVEYALAKKVGMPVYSLTGAGLKAVK